MTKSGRSTTPSLPVAAGHASKGDGSIRAEECEHGKPRTILKVLDEVEFKVYSDLSSSYARDPMHQFIPAFEGTVDDPEKCSRFIRIANLLQNFNQPKVMDVKIGVRTFLESESSNPKLREDLYNRLVSMYPEEATPAEHAAKAITKHRFMSARDQNSTISKLGFRIDGVAGYRFAQQEEVAANLAEMRTLEDTCGAFREFAELVATDDGEAKDAKSPQIIVMQLRRLLELVQESMQASAFVSDHEFIGSSILLVADASGRVGAFWIDFAKTQKMSDGAKLTHCQPWVKGNHEDGVLTGLASMINAMDRVMMDLNEEDAIGQDGCSSLAVEKSFSLASSKRRFLRLPRFASKRADSSDARESESVRGSASCRDISLLSCLPSLEGTVADSQHRIWSAGSYVQRCGTSGVYGMVAVGAAAGLAAADAAKWTVNVAASGAAAAGLAASEVAVAGAKGATAAGLVASEVAVAATTRVTEAATAGAGVAVAKSVAAVTAVTAVADRTASATGAMLRARSFERAKSFERPVATR